MKTSFFATRTIARNFASEHGGKVKDFGKDAPAGERWAVLAEAVEVPAVAVVKETPVTMPVVDTAKLSEVETNFAAALKSLDVHKAAKVTKRIGFLNNVEKLESTLKTQIAEVVSKITGGIIGEQYLTNDKNKRVRVMYRRNMLPVRLAMSIAKTA